MPEMEPNSQDILTRAGMEWEGLEGSLSFIIIEESSSLPVVLRQGEGRFIHVSPQTGSSPVVYKRVCLCLYGAGQGGKTNIVKAVPLAFSQLEISDSDILVKFLTL